MYSEQKDFEEKINVFNGMKNAINSLCGNDQISASKLALEVGGSGGLLAGIVSNAGPRVICTDIVDTQVAYNGEFSRLIKEKFERNGLKLNLGKVEFHQADAQNLLYADEKFDFVYSLNAFEHIPDPLIAISEVARVLRKGGIFFASFDPVWTADSGSHFIDYVQDPWLHLLLNHNDYRKKNARWWC
jgi:SAM-dependent methyltransferase